MAIKQLSRRSNARLVTARNTRSFKSNDFVAEIVRILSLALADVSFIFAAVLCGFVIITHMDDLSSGPLGKFLENNSNNKLVAFILSDIDKFFGVLMMAPVSLRVHKSMRSFVFAASTAIIIIVPALHIWAYLVSAFCVLLFVNLRDPVYKAIVMGGMSFYLYFEMKHSADPPDRFEAPVPQYNA